MTEPGTIILNDGNAIPQLGLGLWLVDDFEAAKILRAGVDAGYRLFDTAEFYKNEAGLGKGFAELPVSRDELCITTKLWNTRHGYDEALRAFEESMGRLRLDYLDLYLIHWPVAGSEKYVETWKALIRLRKEGRVRSIGVSNFLERHLRRLVDETGVAPAVNQIEYQPYFQPDVLVRAAAAMGTVTESWAPLGRGMALADPVIGTIAARHGKSPAQIIIRWQLDKKHVVIPKSANPVRMRENLDVFGFTLSPEDRAALDNLDTGKRSGEDPDVFTGLDLE